jgi:hypothetical protein
MRRFILLSIVMLVVGSGFVFGKKVVELSNLVNPNSVFSPLTVDDNYIYITDGLVINIYSASDYKWKKSFGKRGEGPQEFMGYDTGCVLTTVTPDYIIVDSLNKLSFFTKEGIFKKEIKIKRDTSAGYIFRPFGDKYLAYKSRLEKGKVIGALFLYDSDFNRLKELANWNEFLFQEVFNPYARRKPVPLVYKNKLFVNNYDNGDINVFDTDGKKLYSINYPFEKVEVTNWHKKETHRIYKTDPRFKLDMERARKKLTFPKYLPPMKGYNVSDGKIYVLTYIMKDEKSEFIVLDTRGKFLKKIMFPLVNLYFLEPYPYNIRNGKIFQLVENEEETWELHISDLEL